MELGQKLLFILSQNTLYWISFYPHDRNLTPRYLSPSITDSVTSHCIKLTLLGSTSIKLQEPSQETRNWELPVRTNPPLACNTQTTGTTNNNYYNFVSVRTIKEGSSEHEQLLDAKKTHNACCAETEPVVSLFITLICDGSLQFLYPGNRG
jgi:hypothetical protein